MSETKKRENAPHQGESLDHRYGKIAIPAVAAALRYNGARKNPEYAPAEFEPRHIDEAA